MGTHARGAAATRNLKAGELITSLETARAYVQELADESPEQATSLIASEQNQLVAGVFALALTNKKPGATDKLDKCSSLLFAGKAPSSAS